ncbi:Chk1 protein kinase [Elasticomyces elasticus]|nr:Chk1 protein kinase [Elasticomyces elasticus]
MLDSCYRKKCIYYSWRDSAWRFDLDKIFKEFESQTYGSQINNDFITRRLRELSPDSQALLAWSALIGTSFSFQLIKRVMSCDCSRASPAELLPPASTDAVAGLQAALSAYVLIPSDDEDRFRFSHDRYMQAADLLSEPFSKEEMHFVIACAMMHHDPYDLATMPTKILFDQARHVTLAAGALKRRVKDRAPFRNLLYQAAETARGTGSRSIGLHYFKHCLDLLQDDPWDESLPDVRYQETLTLMTKAAEAYWYSRFNDKANKLLKEIFDHAKVPADAAPAWIIQSRMYSQIGDDVTAFSSLKNALFDLGMDLPDTTYAECDVEFQRLLPLIVAVNTDDLLAQTPNADRTLLAMTAVLVELTGVAFWSDSLLFYQITLNMVDHFFRKGVYPQLGLAYIHLAAIAVQRFRLADFGVQAGNVALKLFAKYPEDTYIVGRGQMLHALFLGHLETHIRNQMPLLKDALDSTISAGSKTLHLLNIGVITSYRLWSSEDIQEVEASISEVSDEFPNWQTDLRGGIFLMAVKQYCRAMQGITDVRSAEGIFCDEEHDSRLFCESIKKRATHPERPLTIYRSYQMVALYRYGFYREALELGESVVSSSDHVWSIRFGYSNMFYLSLSIIAMVREDPTRPDKETLLQRVQGYRNIIKDLTTTNDVNYATWLLLLAAEVADITETYDSVHVNYEAAINHAILHGFVLDEAFSYELYADFLVRRGAGRPARGMVLDAVSAYRRISAFGKADQLMEKHGFLLHGTRSLAKMDVGTQTTAIDTSNTAYKLEQNEVSMVRQTSADRMQAWLSPNAPTDQHRKSEASTALQAAMGLDMIDLASILESSQLISSEIKVERLLEKLTEIMIESTASELCGLVVHDEEVGWCVAAVGNPDRVQAYAAGQPLEDLEDPVAKQVSLYVLRFKEQVFVRNVLEDERFANVPASWLKQNPDGKAIVALPILHGDSNLLGSIYVEGPPNSFTERHTTVLKLLVNQMSISIANALLFKKLEKVSASNAAMLEAQKQSLTQARDAERKAKVAEAQAMENVRLKEEAAKAKSMFLANVSHELRTPLNGVIGMSELLKGSKLNKEQEGFADSIRICADTLLSVINDLLDYSKLEAGKMQMFSVPLSLTETISEVVRALSYTNMERGLKTREELALDRNMLVMGDPVRLHQILMNLLSNAYKFTSRGSVTVRATIDREDNDSIEVTCSVTDTGIGVSEEQRKKLFMPFSQADSSTARSYGGTGLGLSICKAIIENVMQGRIWMESTLGVGTTVLFRLPFQKVLKTTDPQGMSTSKAQDVDPMAIFSPPTEPNSNPTSPAVRRLASVPREDLKIAIAEDNMINQRIAKSFVQKLGFECEAFGDGQQTVDALTRASQEGKPFHLVLMDIQMPVLDGYDATREIRKHPDPAVQEVLIIALTASAIAGDRSKCLDVGMNNYLAKPIRANMLKQMLESYLNQTPKPMPHLQQEARRLAKEVIEHAADHDGQNGDIPQQESALPTRPPTLRHDTTEIRLGPKAQTGKEA